LVEPTASRPVEAEEAAWPEKHDAGRLEWDDPASTMVCAACDALLLPSEAKPLKGRAGVVGKNCCMDGQVRPPLVGPYAHWYQELWLGWPGEAFGEAGLLRTAARKFARPLGNALALASQTVKQRTFGGDGRGSSTFNPAVVIEGRVARRVGSLLGDANEQGESFIQMYVHDGMYDAGGAGSAGAAPQATRTAR